jgi:hypothetical protein
MAQTSRFAFERKSFRAVAQCAVVSPWPSVCSDADGKNHVRSQQAFPKCIGRHDLCDVVGAFQDDQQLRGRGNESAQVPGAGEFNRRKFALCE